MYGLDRVVVYLGIPLIVLSYLIGSFSASYIIGRVVYKIDITKMGSGNAGGANAARIMGMKVGIFSGLIDLFKGTLAIWIASLYTESTLVVGDIFEDPNWIIVFSGFAVILGHCYSPLLKFKGGKGGATTAGVILFFNLEAFLVMLFVWFVVVGTTRFTSLGNLVAVIVIPFMISLEAVKISLRLTDYESTGPYILFSLAVVLFIYFKHRDNLVRLGKGIERKVGEKVNQ